MLEKITNNIGWKILSIVLAFLLWLFVVNYEDPSRTKEFKDIPVDKINVNEITDKKKAIEYVQGEHIDVVLRGKRSVIDRLSEEDIYAYADMGNVSITGAIDIEVNVKEGITVISKTPSTMKINVEDIITVQKEIQYYFEGEPKKQYVALEPVITPNTIQITGPESKIMQIASVVIPVTIDNANKDVTLFGIPQLLNNNNEEVLGVESNVEQVEVYVQIEKMKNVPIIFEAADELPPNYKLTDVVMDVNSVKVRGKEEIINNLNKIVIDDISLNDLTETSTKNVNLESYLPEGVSIVDVNKHANIKFVVSPIVEKNINLMPNDITVKNLPEGLMFSYINENAIKISFQGVQSELNKIDIETLEPYITLRGYKEGTHQVEVHFDVPDEVEMLTDTIYIEILLEEEEKNIQEEVENDNKDEESNN